MSQACLANAAPSGATQQLLHDARNHLWNLSGLGQLLAQSSQHPEAELFVRCMRNETQQIVHLLESLCAVTQGANGDEAEATFDVSEHLLVLANALHPLARQSGVQLDTAAPEAPVAAVGKPRLLNRLLGNLIRNAITHARAQRVRVSVAIEPGARLRYVVSDDGIGVAAAQRRAHRHSADPIGHGHGLAICASLAGQLGATLCLGPAEGGGTAAELVLPLR